LGLVAVEALDGVKAERVGVDKEGGFFCVVRCPTPLTRAIVSVVKAGVGKMLNDLEELAVRG
jgi:hypothetical protein